MSADDELHAAVTRLCRDVSGIDWNAAAVQTDVNEMLGAVKAASPAARERALGLLVDRLRAARLEDADGVQHIAISAGTMVEYGAPAQPLAEVLLVKLPDILAAARRFADRCLAELQPLEEDEEDEVDDALVLIDGRAISLELFRKHLANDRAGACALNGLEQWTLPTVAALTRDRESLRRACANPELEQHAVALRDSAAHWLHVLLGAELDAKWRVLFPLERRGFVVAVDGVTSNFELHTLVAATVIQRGIAGNAPPKSLVAFLEGTARDAGVPYVKGVWSYYSWRAAAHDLARAQVPTDLWVWNEGAPRDVPVFDGIRTLLVGPATINRTWNVSRPFSAMAVSVRVVEELSVDDVQAMLARMKQTAL